MALTRVEPIVQSVERRAREALTAAGITPGVHVVLASSYSFDPVNPLTKSVVVTVAIDESDPSEREVGSGLVSEETTIVMEVYGASEAKSMSIARTIKESFNNITFLPIYDYSDADVEVDRQIEVVNCFTDRVMFEKPEPYRTFLRYVTVVLSDEYYRTFT